MNMAMTMDVSEVTGMDESLDSAFTLEALLGADHGPKPGPLFEEEGCGKEDGDGGGGDATATATPAKDAGRRGRAVAVAAVDILADVGAGAEAGSRGSRSVLENSTGQGQRSDPQADMAGSRERAEMDADWVAFRRALISPGPPSPGTPTPGVGPRKTADRDRDRDDWRSALRHMEESGGGWPDVGMLDVSDSDDVSPGDLDRSLSQTLARLVDVLDHQGGDNQGETGWKRGWVDKDLGTEVMGTVSTMDESLSQSRCEEQLTRGQGGSSSPTTNDVDSSTMHANANTVMVESDHPYEAGVDSYRIVQLSSALAGAAGAVLVSFDPLSQTAAGDYVTIFRDDAHQEVWGAPRYHGGGVRGRGRWAGVGREPALLIPASRFIVHLHSEVGYTNGSDGDSGDVDSSRNDEPSLTSLPRGWGFRLLIRPVAVSGVTTGATTTAAAEPEARAHAGALSPLPLPQRRGTPKSTPRTLRRARASPAPASSRVAHGNARPQSPAPGTPGTARARRSKRAEQPYGHTVAAFRRSRDSGTGAAAGAAAAAGGGAAQRVRRTIGGAMAVSPARPSRDRSAGAGPGAGARPGWTAQPMRAADSFSAGVRARRFAL